MLEPSRDGEHMAMMSREHSEHDKGYNIKGIVNCEMPKGCSRDFDVNKHQCSCFIRTAIYIIIQPKGKQRRGLYLSMGHSKELACGTPTQQ